MVNWDEDSSLDWRVKMASWKARTKNPAMTHNWQSCTPAFGMSIGISSIDGERMSDSDSGIEWPDSEASHRYVTVVSQNNE